jgi:hypothetical protein
MTITADKVGRNLHITLEGVPDPFVIRPLPGRAGIQVTDTYLTYSGGDTTVDMLSALTMAVDGARQNAITGLWEPLPEAEQINMNRIGLELSQEEGNDVIMPALFWQTILGLDGVKQYIEGGEGLAGTLKAAGALAARLGRLAPRTSPRESATD